MDWCKSIENCRKLRREQTEAEKKLWNILRNRQLEGTKFRRQHLIDKYIIDFYSSQYKIAIEADGGQHYTDKGEEHDRIRTEKLAALGIELIRFSNLDILNNIDGVCEIIQRVIERKRSNVPHPIPLPKWERGVKINEFMK